MNDLKIEIKDDQRMISNLRMQETEIRNQIKNFKHLRVTHLYVRLGEIQKLIKDFEEFSKHKHDYFKYASSQLIIC